MLTTIVLGLAAASASPVPIADVPVADAPVGAAADQIAAETPEDIVVTAQRRAERPIDVPIALTPVSSETIDRLRTRTIRDLSLFVPGLYVEAESPGRAYVAIRGIATNVPDISSEPRVSVFDDGVSVSRTQAAIGELYDIARVEVARGPQTTLYGRSALVGAVNIVSNRPDPTRFDYAARAEVGNLDTRQFDAMVNVPLGEGVAARLAGRERERGGYVKNLGNGDDFGGFRTWAGRARLTIAPGTVGSLDLIARYEHDRTFGTGARSRTFLPTDPATGTVLGDRTLTSGVRLSDTVPFGGRRSVAGLTALARFEVAPRVTLNSTTGYRGVNFRAIEDIDGTALPIFIGGEDNKGNQFSQEIRLEYTAPRFNLMLGVNGFTEQQRRTIPTQFDERLTLALLVGGIDRTNPVLRPQSFYTDRNFLANLLTRSVAAVGGVLPNAQALAIADNLQPAHREQYTQTNTANALDLFADGQWAVTDRLNLQAGVRLAIDDRRTTYRSTTEERSIVAGFLGALRQPAAQRTALLRALAAPGAAFIPQSASFPLPFFAISQPSNGTEARSLSSSGLSWRFTARYDLADDARIFANYARGRRPDVTSAAAPLTPFGAVVFTDLAAETVDSVELGAKWRGAGGRIALDGTIYGYRYNNFQTQAFIETRIVSIDAGRANAYGGEIQAELRPFDAVSLVGNYAYNHARFRSGLYDGNRFRSNPEHTAALAMIVRAPVGDGQIELSPNVAYRSRFFFDDTNGNPALLTGALIRPVDYRPSQAGFVMAGGRVRYRAPGGRFAVEAYVDNLFDTTTVRNIGTGTLQFGLPTYSVAPPRTVGVAVSFGGSAR